MHDMARLNEICTYARGSRAFVLAGILCLLTLLESSKGEGVAKIESAKAYELLHERDILYGADDPFGESGDLYYVDTVTPAAPVPQQESQPVVTTTDDDDDDDDDDQSSSGSSGNNSGGSVPGDNPPPGGGNDPPGGGGGVVDPPPGGG